MPDLSVEALCVRFPGLEAPALEIASLDLPAGSRVALTGASGSGKTTFINAVTGLERVRAGSVRWGGTDLAALGEARRDRWRAAHVGLVMQDFHLFAGLSAIDNVLLPHRLSRALPLADVRETGERLLRRFGIERFGQRVETLSRGQMQRVAVARALAGRPAILVADEPTASLDAEAGRAVADLLLELGAETGFTLIVATHDPSLVSRMDRVLRLANGRLTDGARA
ncbi:ABC transporter ATP-binding protein [uncultured Aureimonas sp.]|uniref:ABC transporter ATP-binding protein n=1 Tax=uncultured Aureimonas sp. TaxID=1604662 RepID=UPI0025D32139|nr:ATP-binding cassette domain-containing protein [uncultured Aureimonas sp.]